MDTPGLISTMSLSLLPSWADLAYRKTDENVTALKALYDINGSLPILAGTGLLSATLAFVFLRRKVEAIAEAASQNDHAVKKLEERPYGGNLMDSCPLHISNYHAMVDCISRH